MMYRFIGTNTVIDFPDGPVHLTHFGQAVDLPLDIARAVPVLKEEAFAEIFWDEEEVARYAEPGSHPDAPPEFLARKQRALARLGGKRA
jgi:hypothetical protein